MKSPLLLRLLLPLLVAFTTTSRAADSAPLALLDGMSSRIESALNHGDEAAVAAELAKCEAILTSRPDHPRASYYKALVLASRASRLISTKDDGRAKGLFEAAEATLKNALKSGRDAEVLSLHASVLERSIAVKGGFAAMKLGPAASAEHDESAELAPSNPRVAMLRGISLLNRPGFVGGSAEKALAEFERAAGLFDREASDSTEANGWAPTWGRAEVWAWIGQAHLKLGSKEKAREAFEKGLQVDPNYGWIRYVLLPKVTAK